VVGTIRREGGRNDQAIGLNAAIDFRNIASHHKAGGSCPGGIAPGEFVGALRSDPEKFFGAEDLFLAKEFVAVESEADGLVKDQNVGKVGIAFERVELSAEPVEARAQLALIGLGDRNSGSGERLVLRSLGIDGERKEEDCGKLHANLNIISPARAGDASRRPESNFGVGAKTHGFP